MEQSVDSRSLLLNSVWMSPTTRMFTRCPWSMDTMFRFSLNRLEGKMSHLKSCHLRSKCSGKQFPLFRKICKSNRETTPLMWWWFVLVTYSLHFQAVAVPVAASPTSTSCVPNVSESSRLVVDPISDPMILGNNADSTTRTSFPRIPPSRADLLVTRSVQIASVVGATLPLQPLVSGVTWHRCSRTHVRLRIRTFSTMPRHRSDVKTLRSTWCSSVDI